MLPLLFVAQVSNDDPYGFLKSVAIAALIMGAINAPLWFRYLSKENRNKAHDHATMTDLEEMETRLCEKLAASNSRMDHFETALEERTLRLYDTIDKTFDKVEQSFDRLRIAMNQLGRDIGKLEGEAQARKGNS